MFILWRSWITFTTIIATVLIVLALLSSLQHNALYSDLIRQRLSVVAQTTADSFKSVVNLGLPISMVRNARPILERGPQVSIAMTVAESNLADPGSNAVLGSLRTLERGGSIVGLILVAWIGSKFGYPTAIGVVGAWCLAGVIAFIGSMGLSGGLVTIREKQ